MPTQPAQQGADLTRVEDGLDNVEQHRSLTAGGTRYQFTSNPQPYSDVRVGDTAAVTDPNKLAQLFPTVADRVPNVARAGALTTHRNPYANRPVIEVYRREGVSGEAMLVGKYDDWICSNVVESDAEKFDIFETFGNPHFFTSGRFVRKYQFTGTLRAAPVNYQAVQNPTLRTPQFVLFRVFYEYYLRSTKQAELGYYTRIVVDNEAYEGYVTTMNFQRSADTEALVPFVFTFIGTKRYNTQTETDARALLKRFESKVKVKNPIVTQLAQAELADAHGALDLTALIDSIDIGTITADKQNPNKGVAQQNLKLKAEGVPQVLLVTSDTPGIDLIYTGVVSTDQSADDASVNGNPVRISSSGVDITYRITNFAQIRQEFERRKADAAPGSDIAGTAKFKITAENGKSVVMSISMTLSGVDGLTVASVVINAGNPAQSISDTPVKSSTPRLPTVLKIDRSALQAGNVLPVSLLFSLKQNDGSSLLAAAFADPKVSFHDVSAVAQFGGHNADADSGQVQATNVDLANAITPSAGQGTVRTDGTLVLNNSADLRSANPFKIADHILVTFVPKVEVSSYAAFDSFPQYQVLIDLGKSNANDLLAKLDVIRFAPAPDVPSSFIGRIIFAIYTKNNQAPDPSALAALQRGTLNFTMNGGSLALNAPLNGRIGTTGKITISKIQNGTFDDYGVYVTDTRVAWNGQFIAITVSLYARAVSAVSPTPNIPKIVTALSDGVAGASLDVAGFILPAEYHK